MATKSEIKSWLKEIGSTEAQIDALWEDLHSTNSLTRQLTKSGVGWRKLNIGVIKSIPTQKERDILQLKGEEQKEEERRMAAEIKQAEKENYIRNFESIMEKKIDAGEELSEEELAKLISNYEIDELCGYTGRWDQHIQSIVELNGRTFAILWNRGLTEYQMNSYSDQPYEVIKFAYNKMITVVEWKAVRKK